MLKHASFFLAVALLCLPGMAQTAEKADGPTRGDVAAGYSYVHATLNGPYQSFNGVSFSGAYDFNRWLAAAADVDIAHATVFGVGANIKTYTFGPRFFYRAGRFMPFAEFLFGAGTATANYNGISTSNTNFALNLVGGTDIALDKKGHIAVRPEVAYLDVTRTPRTSGVHVGAGIAYHF